VLDFDAERQAFEFDVPARPHEIALDPDLRLFRRLGRDEAPPILREVMVDPETITVLLPEADEARKTADALAAALQDHSPKLLAADARLPDAPLLVIGLGPEVDAWIERRGLPSRPERVRGKGSAQAWTATRENGGTVAIVSAGDSVALSVLARPLPHYGRQSYVIFEGAQVIERGAWPARVQTVSFAEE